MSPESPNGCLACNREEIEAYLKENHVNPATQVKRVQNTKDATLPPCEKCGALFRSVEVNHSISEDWSWLVRDKADGSKEIFGVQYPNGDRKLAVNMPFQQWRAYIHKGKLKSDKHGNLSTIKDRN